MFSGNCGSFPAQKMGKGIKLNLPQLKQDK
jgi:hypothetical protein